MHKTSVDGLDRKLLQALQQHPNISIAEIGERVGLSQTACWRRLKRMQDEGIVRGRYWSLDAEKLGLEVSVFAEVRLKQHGEETLEAFEAMTRSHPEIVECFSMSGESDYLLRIVIGSVADYEVLLKKVLLHLPGVAAVNSSFALKTVKLTADLPL